MLLFVLAFGLLGVSAWAEPALSAAQDRAAVSAAELPEQSAVLDPFAQRMQASQAEVILRPETWEGRSLSLADVLAEQAGIETRRYGGLGSFQTVSIRGSTGARVQVYLDDVPLNSAGGAPVDLGKIDLDLLDRVEIRKGIAPAEDGGNAMGGVIRLYTRGHSHATLRTRLSTAVGSHGLQKHALSVGSPASGPNLGATVFANFAFTRSDNDFRYLDRNQTPYNLDDDAWVRRENSAYRDVEAHAQAQWRWGGGEASVKLAHSRDAGGLPGREGEVTHTAGFSDRTTQYFASYSRGDEQIESALLWSVEAFAEEENPVLHWTRADAMGWTMPYDTVRLSSLSFRQGATGNISRKRLLDKPLQLKARAAVSRERLMPWDTYRKTAVSGPSQNNSSDTAWRDHRFSTSLAVDAILSPGSTPQRNFEITLGTQAENIREHHEGAQLPFGGKVPVGEFEDWQSAARLGLASRFADRLSLYLNAGRYYHLPSLVDRFGGRLGMIANPNLKPEQGLNAEAGARLRWRRGFLELGLFRHSAEDVIFYEQVANNFIRPSNLDASLAQGLEATWQQDLPWGLSFSVTATAQDARNTAEMYNGKRLPNQPVWSHHSRLSSALPWGFRAEHLWDFRSEVFRDPGNLQGIPAQNLHHLLLHWTWNRRLAAHFSMQNVTNVFYEDAYASYPYPGRQYQVTLTAGL